jgi:hypothetical protein
MLPPSALAVSGSYVVKCGRTGSPEMRILSFTDDFHLQWKGKRGKLGSVDVRLLSDIRIGQTTQVFQDLSADELVDVSFSLILSDRTLDLVVSSTGDATELKENEDVISPAESMIRGKATMDRRGCRCF